MRPSLGLLLLLLGGLALSAHGSEIINGEKVPNGEMLYMASVQNATGTHICGGFLISRDTVVTAAHCDDKAPTSVVLGTHDLNKRKKIVRYNVTRCKHHAYKGPKYGNDIMLLKLSKKVPEKSQRIKAIPLPKAMKIKDDTTCVVAGWGIATPNGPPVHQLQKVDVLYKNLSSCKKEWQEYARLPDTVICAGGFTEDGKGFCQGDSGGPLLCNGVPVGIVSFNWMGGDKKGNCCYPNLPNVYTNLSKYMDWIKKTEKKNKC